MISHKPRPDLSQTQASFYVYLPLSYMDLSLTLQKETADTQIAKDFLLLLSSIESGLCCRWSAAVVDKVQVIARCSRPCLRYEDRGRRDWIRHETQATAVTRCHGYRVSTALVNVIAGPVDVVISWSRCPCNGDEELCQRHLMSLASQTIGACHSCHIPRICNLTWLGWWLWTFCYPWDITPQKICIVLMSTYK